MRSLKYAYGIEKSSEFLRLTIPLMSRQAAAPHPVSYAIWYTYVSGVDGALNREIDGLLKSRGQLDEDITLALYNKYLLDPDEARADKVGASLENVCNEVAETAASSARNVTNFNTALETFSDNLARPDDKDRLAIDVRRVLENTSDIKNSIGNLMTVIETSRAEVDELRQQLKQTTEEAISDTLTGLRNRRGFENVLREAIQLAETENQPLSLILIDIDHFKSINDSYGHVLGDKVLRFVARLLEESVRGSDTAARIGGDELAVLLPRTTMTGARTVAEAICGNVARARLRGFNGEHLTQVTVSIGAGVYRAGESDDKFVDRIDAAMYNSKKQGRNRTCIAD